VSGRERAGIGALWGERSRVRGGGEGVAVVKEKGTVGEGEDEAVLEVESKCSRV